MLCGDLAIRRELKNVLIEIEQRAKGQGGETITGSGRRQRQRAQMKRLRAQRRERFFALKVLPQKEASRGWRTEVNEQG